MVTKESIRFVYFVDQVSIGIYRFPVDEFLFRVYRHSTFRMENKHTDKLDNDSGNHSGQIGTSEFLDFLKLACRVHESIILKDDTGKTIDYNALAKNELVNTLVNSKSGQSPKSNVTDDNCGNEKTGEFIQLKLELF